MELKGTIVRNQRITGNVDTVVPLTGVLNVGRKSMRELRFLPLSDFPPTGKTDTLYIDTDGNTIYYWNDSQYVNLSGEEGGKIYAKTTAEWSQLTSLQSEFGAIYIYMDYRQEDGVNIPAMKIGDGQAYVVDLPFFSTGVTEADRQRWDNKVSAMISPLDIETLILYTD